MAHLTKVAYNLFIHHVRVPIYIINRFRFSTCMIDILQ